MDIFMIIFIWVWGQSAPTALKVICTFILAFKFMIAVVNVEQDRW